MDVSVAVTDDVETDRLAIARDVRAALAAHPGVVARVSTYASAEEMLASFEPASFQLAFLDVRLEGADGISLATELRRLDADLLIVFVTTEADYALTAYPDPPLRLPREALRAQAPGRSLPRRAARARCARGGAHPQGALRYHPRAGRRRG